MRVAAFDVGVSNLAFCVMSGDFEIEEWMNTPLGGKTVQENVRSLHSLLQKNPYLLAADVVLIERQMASNPRMSSLASALLMYFLSMGRDARFTEAAKRRSGFLELLAGAGRDGLPRSKHRRNKAESVMCVRFVVEGVWRDFFERADKKDDLADTHNLAYSFLKENRAVVV